MNAERSRATCLRFILGLTGMALLAVPAGASAAERYASPSGSGPATTCPQSNPCDLQTAVEDPSVSDGDVVRLAPGTYTENNTLLVSKNITVRGVRGAPTVASVNTTAALGVVVDSQNAVIEDLSINQVSGQDALTVLSGLAQRLMVYTEGQFACTTASPSINESRVRDSSCIAAGVAAIAALRTSGGGPGTVYGRAVNVTARGIGPNSVGAIAFGSGGSLIQLDLLNTIAAGVVSDVNADANDPGTTISVFGEHSNYGTELENSSGGGAVAVADPGSGTNQTAEPLLGPGQYPAQLPGSPTIDAGNTFSVFGPNLIGDLDLAGEPRVEGGAPDIGADEADGTPPSITIDSGPSGPTTDSTPTFRFSSSEPAAFECRFDGALAGFAPCSGPDGAHTPPPLPDGAYTFTVRGTDAFGNASSVSSAPFRVDTTAPETQITSGPRRRTRSRTVRIGFGSADPTATFECRLDRASFAPCTSPLRLRRVRSGRHVVQVRATDDLGNVDSTPAVSRWRRPRG